MKHTRHLHCLKLLILAAAAVLPALASEAGLKIYYIRHAESGDNAKRHFIQQGIPESEWPAYTRSADNFSPAGEAQVPEAAKKLKGYKFDFIASSPVWRVRQTILPYLRDTKQTAEIWPELAEITAEDVPLLFKNAKLPPPNKNYLTGDLIASTLPGAEKPFFTIRPGGERLFSSPKSAGLEQRAADIEASLKDVVALIKKRFGGPAGANKKILLAGHGGNGRALIDAFLDPADRSETRLNIRNIAIWMVEEQPDGKFKLVMFNDQPYSPAAKPAAEGGGKSQITNPKSQRRLTAANPKSQNPKSQKNSKSQIPKSQNKPQAENREAIAPEYRVYAGNTHSHTANTWSHGAQWLGKPDEKQDITPQRTNVALKSMKLKPDWQKFQGPPSQHYTLAKKHGFDFYAVTDHSQEEALHPTGPNNPAWREMLRDAAAISDANFIALAGFEYSENDGPGGKGHINVINASTYLNALEKGMDLPYLYKWLQTVKPNGDGPVVAVFNHPAEPKHDQCGHWNYRDAGVTDIITMCEVVNGDKYKKEHYDAWLNALEKGWKLAPVSGHDNHASDTIARRKSRTFVLATAKTKPAILDAMKNRRAYAALKQRIDCRYTVNGQIMGSTLAATAAAAPTEFRFDIAINDPDTGNPAHKITKIDIVTDAGKVVQTHAPTPAHSVRWSPVITDTEGKNKYYFVRVWSASGGDVPSATPESPVAILAPVWTGR